VRAESDAVWVAGLPDEVRVITVGQGFVRTGDQVRPVPEGATAAPGPLVAESRG
jgi:multidrug efflux system membrane fusion protein